MEGEPKFEGAIARESIEKPKFHYVYVDNSKSGHPKIFECDADDILKADELYEQVTGKKPEKQDYVGCSVVKNN